tara:strand:- start:1245 stop:2459 length:1215 start_codon:yes stop_codon:yes gene_type:complete
MNADFLIIGGGMVGLSIANQFLERNISKNIVVIDKEKSLGIHSSGLNSGVLHSGVYYKPGTLKSKVCVSGSRRLKKWIKERNLPINECGKIIIPQDENLDNQLDVLKQRATKNGAKVELINEKELKSLEPFVKSSTGRALWSPNTVVVKSKIVLNKLESELREKGVKFFLHQKNWDVDPLKCIFFLDNGNKINYGHLINCSGLHADRVAKKFNIGEKYRLFPFKGIYWALRNNSEIKINRNIYPVPDLNVPFLGVHFTPSADEIPTIYIGPTATPALGRENYKGLDAFEPLSTLSNLLSLAGQYLQNNGGFRKYVHEQLLLALKPVMLNSAKKLIPSITNYDIVECEKVGIRSQLFNLDEEKLEDDFLCLEGPSSTHVMNAISPAFTASFSLADLIIDQMISKI